MRFKAVVTNSFVTIMRDEQVALTAGVVKAAGDTTSRIKKMLRSQTRRAGLGRKLPNTWRGQTFKNDGIDAASFIYSNAPNIVDAFDRGARIRPKGGKFLAIPTRKYRYKAGRKRASPRDFSGRLALVPSKKAGQFYLFEKTKPSGGRKYKKRLKRGKKVLYKSSRTKAKLAFTLVKGTTIKRRLNVDRVARRGGALFPELIIKYYKEGFIGGK